ncbi:MAG: hypothetical protein A2087_08545 [Spirochaetes bacterium GWD1_61_31]|nr:MAG: hypothetical protein A2Y37_13270 [Spirochaetes bacterium GWB1_60_80]OHD35494.1 MAG: hypothetical protein A2004_08585 [Spirochaetes bacterium GWC1_61_12]OHD36734.1 MAG: hypothetical protein A2087_08545 [Spirochaetes bacterium GWD1_61_31]OHD42537.1 MAG: hypothetical protein A2Y35_08065 [Spirochaetes bacterium GWE1_60_18]OHD58250.1 MAG: hypothetical protein A2Y32_04985 [Spirochaetes bacterium GWF1_60_12]
MRKVRGFLAIVLLTGLLGACADNEKTVGQLDVAVFVPGMVAGSPIYEMLVAGATQAVSEVPNATLKIIEAGYNQAEWLDKLTALAETAEFELIVSSNPALPDLCARVAADYPEQRFFIADAYLAGNPAIHTVLYNQQEQGYMIGYLAALYTKELGGPPVVGLIAAQSYPTLDRLIRPGFLAGLQAVDPAFQIEYREIGNWYDAAKAAELAAAIYDSGAQVILPIAGSAGQGVVATAVERDRKVVWFDGSGYQLAPNVVIGCADLAQDRLVYERVKQLLEGDDQLYGQAAIVSVREDYILFDPDGEGYRALSPSVRQQQENALQALAAGQPDFLLTDF